MTIYNKKKQAPIMGLAKKSFLERGKYQLSFFILVLVFSRAPRVQSIHAPRPYYHLLQ